MRAHTLTLACGCRVTIDRRGNESLPVAQMCTPCRDDWQRCHDAAVRSCSHILRDGMQHDSRLSIYDSIGLPS